MVKESCKRRQYGKHKQNDYLREICQIQIENLDRMDLANIRRKRSVNAQQENQKTSRKDVAQYKKKFI